MTETRDDYALAVGKIAIAWNSYHEVLGEIFCSIFTKSHGETSLAIWHCLDSDRTQRKLLRVAAETYLHWNKKGLEELIWLLNKTDTVLSHQRNVGIHAPLMNMWSLDGTVSIMPPPGSANRNAKHIQGMDVLREYSHYAEQILEMRDFASALKSKVPRTVGDDTPWPARPNISSRAPS